MPTANGNGSTLTVTWNRVTRTNGAGPVSSYIVETLDVTNPGNAWRPPRRWIGRTYLVRVKAVALHTGSFRLHRRSSQSRGFPNHTSSARGHHRP